MVSRRLPRWSELEPMIGSPQDMLPSSSKRLSRVASTVDMRRLARRRVPRPVFDYVDGAAGSEITLRRSANAFRRIEFTPRVLRDVSRTSAATVLLGQNSSAPFALAPTGFTRMMHHLGESAVAQAASEAGLPYSLSTLGTTSIERLVEEVPGGAKWFQLYVRRDWDVTSALVERARDSGYHALIVTVDTAVGGLRLRDIRNGMTIPPKLHPATLAQMAVHPRWWANLLTTEPLEFATFRETTGTVSELLSRSFDPAIQPEHIERLRRQWPGRLVIKGVQSLADARMVADLGCDAVILSNHGGRQIDFGGAPLELLPAVVADLGTRMEIYVDGGVRSGSDIVGAVALGATGVLVGRAYLYGLMAGGLDGVRRSLAILQEEIDTTMKLLGATDVESLRSIDVRLRASST